jgi:hypothetical protein
VCAPATIARRATLRISTDEKRPRDAAANRLRILCTAIARSGPADGAAMRSVAGPIDRIELRWIAIRGAIGS